MNTNYMEQKSGEKQVIADERSKFEGVLSKTDRGSWTIFPELCKGCGLCIEKCPVNVISWSSELGAYGTNRVEINAKGCITCKLCALHCPDAAISVVLN